MVNEVFFTFQSDLKPRPTAAVFLETCDYSFWKAFSSFKASHPSPSKTGEHFFSCWSFETLNFFSGLWMELSQNSVALITIFWQNFRHNWQFSFQNSCLKRETFVKKSLSDLESNPSRRIWAYLQSRASGKFYLRFSLQKCFEHKSWPRRTLWCTKRFGSVFPCILPHSKITLDVSTPSNQGIQSWNTCMLGVFSQLSMASSNWMPTFPQYCLSMSSARHQQEGLSTGTCTNLPVNPKKKHQPNSFEFTEWELGEKISIPEIGVLFLKTCMGLLSRNLDYPYIRNNRDLFTFKLVYFCEQEKYSNFASWTAPDKKVWPRP